MSHTDTYFYGLFTTFTLTTVYCVTIQEMHLCIPINTGYINITDITPQCRQHISIAAIKSPKTTLHTYKVNNTAVIEKYNKHSQAVIQLV